MQNKYKDGLTVISVNLDKASDKKQMAKALENLTDKKMGPVINVVLDEEQSAWKSKFGIQGVPCIFVFNRDGKWTKLYGKTLPTKEDGEILHDKIEAFVVELMKEPPPGK